MLYAESDLVQIVTAFLAFLGTCLTAIMAYLMAKLTAGQKAAAIKVEETAVKLDATTKATNQQLGEVAARVEEVHKATNSLTDRLVESTAAASHAAGVQEGRTQAKRHGNP